MARYFLRRLLSAIPTLLVIATLAFVLLHATPGGPFDSDRLLVPQLQKSIEARYHLDEPVWRQFAHYLRDLARGDLSPPFNTETLRSMSSSPGACRWIGDRQHRPAIALRGGSGACWRRPIPAAGEIGWP